MIENNDVDDYYDVKFEIEKENLVSVPDFGVWSLNLRQAAELIVLDMWFSGEIEDISEPEDWDGTEYDAKLVEALAKYIQTFETRLVNAVTLGRLETIKIQRNLDEQISTEQTYINYSELSEWLFERGYESGDIISEWTYKEAGIGTLISKEVNYLRATIKENKGRIPRAFINDSSDDLHEMCKKMAFDNQSLKKEIQQLKKSQSHQTKLNNPVSIKARKSFLLIIEALCKKNNIDSQSRGAAGIIQRLVNTSIGKSIDEDTVKKILNQIPDALE
jgi:hypothetical protein